MTGKGRAWLFGSVGAAVLAGGALLWIRLASSPPVAVRASNETDDLYSPASQVFKRGRRDRPAVCLTIDDGPHFKSLPRILATLKANDVKATFFMVGRRISEHPELVRRALREGHEVGNHTENHTRLDTVSPDQVRMELSLCESNFEQATGGTKMHLFRPPGMRFTPVILKVAREFGYTTVDWNYGGKDFTTFVDGPGGSGENNIAQYVLERVTPGGIILLHDNPDTADALPAILAGLKQRGLAVKNVTEMLADLPKPVVVESNAGRLGKLAMKG